MGFPKECLAWHFHPNELLFEVLLHRFFFAWTQLTPFCVCNLVKRAFLICYVSAADIMFLQELTSILAAMCIYQQDLNEFSSRNIRGPVTGFLQIPSKEFSGSVVEGWSPLEYDSISTSYLCFREASCFHPQGLLGQCNCLPVDISRDFSLHQHQCEHLKCLHPTFICSETCGHTHNSTNHSSFWETIDSSRNFPPSPGLGSFISVFARDDRMLLKWILEN